MFERTRAALADLIQPKGHDSLAGGGTGFLQAFINEQRTPRRGTLELIRSYRTLPWMRAVGNKIAGNVAGTAWRVFAINSGPDGKAERHIAMQRASFYDRKKMMRKAHLDGQLEEIPSHPLLDLLARGNPRLDGSSCMLVTQILLDLKGETFWILERDSMGLPIWYWPVPPHWVSDVPDIQHPFFRIQFGANNFEVPATEVVWFKHPDPENPYGRGTGIGEALGDELDIDEYAAKFTKAFFLNRGIPSVLVGIEGASESELKRAKERWDQSHRGFWRSFRSHFYRAGKLDVEVLQSSLKDMLLNDLRKVQRETIRQVYGVPPEILGIVDNSNRATIRAAENIFGKQVILPRQDFLRSKLQDVLVPMFDDRILLDHDSPVPSDNEAELAAAKAQPSALEANEWRVLAGQDPKDDLEGMHFFSSGAVLDTVAGGGKPAPAATPAIDPGNPDDSDPEDDPGDDTGADPKHLDPPWARRALNRATAADVDIVLEGIDPQLLRSALTPELRQLITEWGTEVLVSLGIETPFNAFDPAIVDFLDEVGGDNIVDITDTAKQRLRSELVEGVEAGESVEDLSKRLTDFISETYASQYEAIAQTEVARAANFATFNAHVQSGVVSHREWVGTPDGRVRKDHDPLIASSLDGQVRAIDQPFTIDREASENTGATALHPLGFGIAAQDVRCRCTTVAAEVDTERSVEERAAIWKQFDERLEPFERSVENAVRASFEDMAKDVLARMRQTLGG